MQHTSELVWLTQWYASMCDGLWEHGRGVHLVTLDNPGWCLEIELNGTTLGNVELQRVLHDYADDDWFAYEIRDTLFVGACSISRLDEMIATFRKMITERDGQPEAP